ncbi:DUF397 domain-containing protein [Amycolatopsis sp. H20-H5]|uniref:DUF397 domain-containing protein n=1 Tax=Amycolatopsis sp. H20-H5 TaxID=3046309 RepID=UPI002DB938E5|nr:DUF397 domain-containing protein [Amycolatopsis sp. H20-H5]MEC3979219.1 DUF397 domain-containing protein [Amycolatopsis sp. H20-H5]
MKHSEGAWRKSRRSQNGNNCVEVALDLPRVGVRDTKDRTGGELTVGSRGWAAFVGSLKH